MCWRGKELFFSFSLPLLSIYCFLSLWVSPSLPPSSPSLSSLLSFSALTFECLITCIVSSYCGCHHHFVILDFSLRLPPGCELTEKIALWQFARLHAPLSAAYCLAAVSSPVLSSRRLRSPSTLQNQHNPLILSPQTFSGWNRGNNYQHFPPSWGCLSALLAAVALWEGTIRK